MLHTDVFNKNNKSKMSKAAYVKNTKLDNVSAKLLEVRLPHDEINRPFKAAGLF